MIDLHVQPSSSSSQPEGKSDSGLTSVNPRGGKRRKAKSTRNRLHRCPHCKTSFRGILGQIYCSRKCRSAARYRRQHPVTRQPKPKPAQVTEPRTCFHCQENFWAQHSTQKYCCASCRALAYRYRRIAAIKALAVVYGLPEHMVEDVADEMGASKLQEILAKNGYTYDERARRWIKPESEVHYA